MDFEILSKGPTQGECKKKKKKKKKKMYLINFTEHNKMFCLNLHYNGANSYLFVNATEIHTFKAKDSETVATPLCLGNIPEDCSVNNMKKN